MSAPDAETAAVVLWLEAHFGGPVRSIARQARWRPVWFAEVHDGTQDRHVCIRGDRTDTQLTFPLDHEMRFQALMHRNGLPVPAVHGWIDEPRAYVMDAVGGQAPFTGLTEAQRDQVVDEYLQALVALHRLPLAPFIAAGIAHDPDPEASGRVGMAAMAAMFRRQKAGPDPFVEFVLGWLARHPVHTHGRQAPVVWDSGQFHHADAHLVAVLDMELAHIGDPMMDLAGWRMRDSIMGFGDFDRIYARYAELAGAPVDTEAIQLHHIAFTLSNQLAFSHALRDPAPGSDFATNLQWCNETNLYATEAIAEYVGVDLPAVTMPEPRPSRARAAHQHLVRQLRSMTIEDPFLRHQVRIAFRLAGHLQRVDEIGDVLVEADIDDVGQLTGRRPEDWFAAEALLEEFVLADALVGAHDDTLLALFHRRNLRAQMLNGPAGSAMARHIPIQPFR